ncbi:MAG TPA: hypothetical protein VFD39_10070, partial [Trueperaceae bacterium]|nr:hypothetical protein [Trueperaceae bacterium]
MSLESPLAVLLDADDRERDWQRSAQHYGGYAVELLEHAGFPFHEVQRAELTSERLPPLLLLPYSVRLTTDELKALTAYVMGGGSVVACGGVE